MTAGDFRQGGVSHEFRKGLLVGFCVFQLALVLELCDTFRLLDSYSSPTAVMLILFVITWTSLGVSSGVSTNPHHSSKFLLLQILTYVGIMCLFSLRVYDFGFSEYFMQLLLASRDLSCFLRVIVAFVLMPNVFFMAHHVFLHEFGKGCSYCQDDLESRSNYDPYLPQTL
eukprot:CAMPEP_0177664414 /NCGR_PEP_ID=MMETSP0447-20121125/20481_1 /TAXON_ID=0 /ORGANISM="Stygamoeba regulata, Strain BSH-02190019" /LENGTH=169 /DNA_ID=CAMNT_0019170385 /DNA_START=134 /DNA_END=643 /DNA_ORIENTATION=-